MNLELAIDFILAGGVLILACLALLVRQVFTGIVLYISLGLLVALVWARLGAWDVAIAEVAIGAGLTGALLLAAWQRLHSNNESIIESIIESPSSLVGGRSKDVS
jgi:energy-converting hydrogenase B subunit D